MKCLYYATFVKTFVDPITGCNTNHVEAFWGRIKKRIRRVCGSQGDTIWDHVDEELYRQWFRMKKGYQFENFELFLQHVSQVYPVN